MQSSVCAHAIIRARMQSSVCVHLLIRVQAWNHPRACMESSACVHALVGVRARSRWCACVHSWVCVHAIIGVRTLSGARACNQPNQRCNLPRPRHTIPENIRLDRSPASPGVRHPRLPHPFLQACGLLPTRHQPGQHPPLLHWHASRPFRLRPFVHHLRLQAPRRPPHGREVEHDT